MFRLGFHTSFITGNRLTLYRYVPFHCLTLGSLKRSFTIVISRDLDKAHKDEESKHFSKEFRIVIDFKKIMVIDFFFASLHFFAPLHM
jgi:hypothetical protein